MRIYDECVICLLRLALRTARTATEDRRLQREVVARVAEEIAAATEDTISPELGLRVQQIVHELTGDADPYRSIRRSCNELVLAQLPRLEQQVESAADPLLHAVRLAAAGNVIDFAVGSTFDLDRTIEESLRQEFTIFDYGPFRTALSEARSILYLADNAGEIVFDRLLVDRLLQQGKRVTVAVRGGPAINDATLEDAHHAGLDSRAELIDTGSALPSVLPAKMGAELREAYQAADLVISKGQGNYEGLHAEPGPILFLLRAKCVPVSRMLGVETGSMILRFQQTAAGPVPERGQERTA